MVRVHWKFKLSFISLFNFGVNWASLDKFGRVRTRQQFRKMGGGKAERIRKGNKLDKFGRVWTSLDEFGQVWTSLDEFGQVWTSLDEVGRV